MKKLFLLCIFYLVAAATLFSQVKPDEKQTAAIRSLIDQYSQARENRDTVLLKRVLTEGVDQLVSTGEWRAGISASVKGMLKSSATRPGARTLTVDKIRMLDSKCALVDCRYEIKNDDGTTRKMWSTFIAVLHRKAWKITAIRNMMPAPNN